MKRRYMIAFCSLALVNSPLCAIHENTATFGAIGGGVAAGALSAWLTSLILNTRPTTIDINNVPKKLDFSHLTNSNKLIISSLVGLGVGGVSWYFLNKYLHTLTPTGRFRAASDLIYFVETDSLIARNFKSTDEIISHANGRFGSSWPLVLARNEYTTMKNALTTAYGLLSASGSEAAGKPEYGDLCTRCKTQQEKIGVLAEVLEQRLNILVNDSTYQFQVTLHEKHLEKERDRQIKEREIAAKQNQKKQDRWHESSEKKKDRELKERLAQQATGPIILNI
ncbi:hypothetical protein K2W90_02265 [Candidatus Babeliales bacterium]|nr:hypothetical protein [Candidatus Babeliales bacterium]